MKNFTIVNYISYMCVLFMFVDIHPPYIIFCFVYIMKLWCTHTCTYLISENFLRLYIILVICVYSLCLFMCSLLISFLFCAHYEAVMYACMHIFNFSKLFTIVHCISYMCVLFMFIHVQPPYIIFCFVHIMKLWCTHACTYLISENFLQFTLY